MRTRTPKGDPMAPACATRLCQFSIAIALCVTAFAAAAAAPAEAGTYDVLACDAAPGGANNSWAGSATLGMVASTACPTQRQEVRGIAAASAINTGSLPLF